MADVRALLRSERASRRLTHPYAAYSSSGQLLCSICHVPVKSESLFDAHLQSTKHALALREVESLEREASRGSKKRKAATDDEPSDRKKSRNEPSTGDESRVGGRKIAPLRSSTRVADTSREELLEPVTEEEQVEELIADDMVTVTVMETSVGESREAIDESEWAAFERDVATPPPEPKALSAFTAPASIQAQPLTASELSAQAKELQGSQRDRREAETAAEKEEASRQLEDEFEEMEALELRVRKLRDQREALRIAKSNLPAAESASTTSVAFDPLMDEGTQEDYVVHSEDEDEDENSEDEDLDNWSFGRP